jgi:hypothetical protein
MRKIGLVHHAHAVGVELRRARTGELRREGGGVLVLVCLGLKLVMIGWIVAECRAVDITRRAVWLLMGMNIGSGGYVGVTICPRALERGHGEGRIDR